MSKTPPPLLLELNPSKKLSQLLLIIHGLALGASFANSLPLAIKLALLIGICLHFYSTKRQLTHRCYAIKHSETLGWEIFDGKDFVAAKIQGSTVITRFAIFLHINKNTFVPILNDALSEKDYRHLICRLKTSSECQKPNI